MTLSDQSPSVSWRLNDLLKAGKKAKAFAAASWQPPEQEPESQKFAHWQPLVVNQLPGQLPPEINLIGQHGGEVADEHKVLQHEVSVDLGDGNQKSEHTN